MGLFNKVLNAIDAHSQMKIFEEDANCIDCIVKAQNFPQFKAIRNKEECVLYTGKKIYERQRVTEVKLCCTIILILRLLTELSAVRS